MIKGVWRIHKIGPAYRHGNITKKIKYLWNMKLRVFLLLVVCFIIARMMQSIGCQKDDDNWTKPIESTGEHEPAFSPDGEFIAYVREPDDEIPDYQIWLFEMATEESEYLTDGWSPDWSPDGKEIVYVFGRDIYKINVETRETQQLTTWGSCFFPDWAPNGELVAFDFSYHTSSFDSFGIWILNLIDDSTKHLGGGRESDWAPSEDRLVYAGYVAGISFREIFIMDSTGQNGIRLTNNQTDDCSPAFSPDGSKIAYVSETRNENNWSCNNIWVMDTTGNNKTQLTFEPEGRNWSGAFDPAWSPDGNRIVYALAERIEKKEVVEYHYHLWLMDTDGENKSQLTGNVTKTFGCK